MDPPEKIEPASLSALAAQILDAVDGDRVKAVSAVYTYLRTDPTLSSEIISRALSIAASQAVAKVLSYRRGRILSIDQAHRGEVAERALERSRNNRVVIMASARLADFPLPSGKRLSDATREDLELAAATLMRGASTLAGRARWLSTLAQRLPPDLTVSQVFSDEELESSVRNTLEVDHLKALT